MVSFLLALTIAAVILFLPGFLLFRGLSFSRIVSFSAAPLFALFWYGAIPIALKPIGLSCTGIGMLGSSLLAGLLAFSASKIITTKKTVREIQLPNARPLHFKNQDYSFNLVTSALYIICASIVFFGIFSLLIQNPEAFFSRWDNQTHLNLIESFVNSGVWSSLSSSVYAEMPINKIPYIGEQSPSGFYPASWHAIAAAICELVNVKVTIAVNALNAILAVAVFPSGMFLMMRALFPQSKSTVAFGAIVSCMLSPFPWAFFIKGPLYPNLAGFAALPAVIGLTILLVKFTGARQRPIAFGTTAIISAIALALSQPNSLFSYYVFAVPFLCSVVYQAERNKKTNAATSHAIRSVAILLLAAITVWCILFVLPPLRSIVMYDSSSASSMLAGAQSALNFFGRYYLAQALLIVLAAIGAFASIKKGRVWLVLPPIYMFIALIVAFMPNNIVKHAICGFWYSDQFRLIACFAIFIVPLAALGLSFLLNKIKRSNNPDENSSYATKLGASILLAILFVAANAIPLNALTSKMVPESGFEYIQKQINQDYGSGFNRNYGADEIAFVDKVVATIPEGSLVINQPNDGSVFSYAVNRLNIYYRSCRAGGQTNDGIAIRSKLNEYTSNDSVKSAVKRSGARYVLQLDSGVPYEKGVWLPQYKDPTPWIGIDSINDDTPGFTAILSEGDMRLYEIAD